MKYTDVPSDGMGWYVSRHQIKKVKMREAIGGSLGKAV